MRHGTALTSRFSNRLHHPSRTLHRGGALDGARRGTRKLDAPVMASIDAPVGSTLMCVPGST